MSIQCRRLGGPTLWRSIYRRLTAVVVAELALVATVVVTLLPASAAPNVTGGFTTSSLSSSTTTAPPLSTGRTFYVSPTGSDTANGESLSTAFQTAAKGVSMALAGDTVRFAEGEYVKPSTSRAGLSIENKRGTVDRPITFTTVAGQERLVIFKGVDTRYGSAINVRDSSYIVVENFEAHTADAVMEVLASDHITVRNNVLHLAGQLALGVRAPVSFAPDGSGTCTVSGAVSSFVTVEGNKVFDTGYTGNEYAEGIYLGQGCANGTDHTHDVTVRDNEIYSTKAEAIEVKIGVYNTAIRNNNIHDINVPSFGAITINAARYGDGVPIENKPDGNFVVENNTINRVTTRRSHGAGIWVANGNGIVRNNTVSNISNYYAIVLSADFGNPDAKSVEVAWNTMSMCALGAIGQIDGIPGGGVGSYTIHDNTTTMVPPTTTTTTTTPTTTTTVPSPTTTTTTRPTTTTTTRPTTTTTRPTTTTTAPLPLPRTAPPPIPPPPPVLKPTQGVIGPNGPETVINGVRTELATSAPSSAKMVAASATTSGGSWVATADGGVFTFGDAGFYGSKGGQHLNRPINAMVPTPTGKGYWLAATDGGIFSFGDAAFYGSLGNTHLNQPIVGMASTRTGRGYWLVASDGGIFTFGDANFYGSAGAIRLNQPISAMAPTPSGRGYWLTAIDGGIFTFGDAGFYGSLGDLRLRNVNGMISSARGLGYWILVADGRLFAFGDAR